jgi:hypothetical protein
VNSEMVSGIKIFLAALAIEFLVRTVTSIFLYILRMAIHTCKRFIPCPSDSQIRAPSFTRSRQQG